MTGKTPTWSMQPQSASFTKVGSDKVPGHSSVKAEGSFDLTTTCVASQGIKSKPFITQVTPNPMNVNHVQHRANFIQAPFAADTHSEISKIVQMLLHPHLPYHPTWTPSRDYMSKVLTCQMCKGTINEVDTALGCDACERGYHLRCLHCNPKAIPRVTASFWSPSSVSWTSNKSKNSSSTLSIKHPTSRVRLSRQSSMKPLHILHSLPSPRFFSCLTLLRFKLFLHIQKYGYA